MASKSYLIFTDLDGSLIDHQNYSLGANDKIIKKLTQNSHQVIINSSKTYSEIKKLINTLHLANMPFSSENGAFIFFPKKIFSKPARSISHERYWKLQLTKMTSRQWYLYLKTQKKNFQFDLVQDTPKITLKKITNLKNITGMLDRMGSQLIIWKDSQYQLNKFHNNLKTKVGGTINEGGRFIQISSPCNKRIAAKVIIHNYKVLFHDRLEKVTIALGDSENDKSMLNFCNYPCVINNPHSTPPHIISSKRNVYKSSKKSPQGWQEAINHLNKVLPRTIL
jgi:mannosyl-3-phosphoglycerate phosphatase family protein